MEIRGPLMLVPNEQSHPTNTSTDASTMKPFIVLPLYIYPTVAAWNSLYSALAEHPEVRFTLIINPSNGPGSSQYPDADYVSAISKLRSFSNVELLGYVHTIYAARPEALVIEDINIYAGWKSHPNSKIHMDGLFFDETPSLYPGKEHQYMQRVATYGKQALGGTIMLNPGVEVDEAYYKISDLVVGCENSHRDYSGALLDRLSVSLRQHTCILVHHFTGTVTDQKDFVTGLIKRQIGGIFVSTEEYETWSKFWRDFCEVVASAD